MVHNYEEDSELTNHKSCQLTAWLIGNKQMTPCMNSNISDKSTNLKSILMLLCEPMLQLQSTQQLIYPSLIG